MRPALVLFPLMLLAAPPPAQAQATLAQQCASFGQAQYRQLDPAVDRIVPNEFPPPMLERFAATVGQQPIAGALTLRGQVTYRGRPAVDTQFVCLLDASHQPLLFYALPALSARAAPTPQVRGAAPAAPPQGIITSPPPRPAAVPPPPPPVQPAPSPSVQAARVRGLLRDAGGRLQLMPCDGGPLVLEDRTPDRELSRALRELTAAQEGRPMFVELSAQREAGLGTGVAALEVKRAAVDTPGCRERFDQREWLAVGNDPAWRLEVTARDLALNMAGVSTMPLPRIAHDGARAWGHRIAYAAADGSDFTVTIDQRRCIDSASGAWFAYYVEVQSEGRSLTGCAAHNPAMPAP